MIRPGKGPLVTIFIIVALGAALLGLFWTGHNASRYSGPVLSLPASEEACVQTRDEMRANHMKILAQWSDMAMREGKRFYVDGFGRVQRVSLQNGCLSCHANRERFCMSCHESEGVTPYCWECHIAPSVAVPGGVAPVGLLTPGPVGGTSASRGAGNLSAGQEQLDRPELSVRPNGAVQPGKQRPSVQRKRSPAVTTLEGYNGGATQ